MAQFVNDYWDNGSLPLWITAQRQVKNQPARTFTKDQFGVHSVGAKTLF